MIPEDPIEYKDPRYADTDMPVACADCDHYECCAESGFVCGCRPRRVE